MWFQQCDILTSVESDEHVQSLVRAFAGRTYNIVGNLMSRLKFIILSV